MKYLLTILLSTALLSAIELTIQSDTNITASDKETKMVVKEYRDLKQDVNYEKIAGYITDNRALANAYLKKHTPLSYAYKKSLDHRIENMLAHDMIKEIQDEIPYAKEDVLYSYYLAKKEQRFMTKDLVSYEYIEFESFEEANEAYILLKDTPSKVKAYITEHKIDTVKFEKVSLTQAYYTVRKFITKENTPLLLPPQYLHKYSLIFISEMDAPVAMKYEDVKQGIEETLFSQTFKEIRKKTIESIIKAP